MPLVAAIGAQWGDEGKGKIVDMLAEKARYVARCSGGDNAGHTVVNPKGEFALSLTPSGIFYETATSIIGNGVVLNPAALNKEIDGLTARGIDTSRLLISNRTNLIMPYHIALDGLEEAARGGKAIGTTGKGIGPAFADKAARTGIRAGDLLNRNYFKERLAAVLEQKNAILSKLYGKKPLSLDDIFSQYCEYADRWGDRICDTTAILADALDKDEPVLLEGAQGFLLDTDFGTYPFATSSSPTVAHACLGAGVPPTRLTHVLGVYKAYQTRVGAGPMPTELADEMGDLIRDTAHEYGTVSGRPRNCGWFDAVAGKLSKRVNGYSSIALTRLDVLDNLSRIKICVAYKIDGNTVENFPADIDALGRAQPVYEELPGWEKPIGNVRIYKELPVKAQRYVKRIEELIDCQASLISVGKRREQTIQRHSIF